MPCRYERCTARFLPRSARNAGARSGRSRLAGDRARAWRLGGARSRLVGGRHWVVEWRDQHGYWRGWAARRAVEAPSPLGRATAGVVDHRRRGRGVVDESLLAGVPGVC
jgi:hypothetical protein